MKPYSRIHQFCAFGLILLFTIQAGLGLWLHNALHQHPAKALTRPKNNSQTVQQGAVVSITCHCTDDFLVPFVGVSNTEVLSPFQAFFTTLAAPDYCHLSCALQVFRPLRAPPILSV